MTEIPRINDRVDQALSIDHGAGGWVLLALNSDPATPKALRERFDTTNLTLQTLNEVGLVTIDPDTNLVTLTPQGRHISDMVFQYLVAQLPAIDN